jgi:hypothetical protein
MLSKASTVVSFCTAMIKPTNYPWKEDDNAHIFRLGKVSDNNASISLRTHNIHHNQITVNTPQKKITPSTIFSPKNRLISKSLLLLLAY